VTIAALGARAYLLGDDMEDFWSLADLCDISGGVMSNISRWLKKMDTQTAALTK
jgi:hypothetical protein